MKAIAIVALLSLTVVSGCLSNSGDDDHKHPTPTYTGDSHALTDSLVIPSGASLTLGPGGPVLNWLGVSSPFEAEFTLPSGATMVRFVADPGETGSVSVSMSNSETGRRRCNQQTVVDLGASFTGARSCSSIAAVDSPGTNWTARATSGSSMDVRVEFYAQPLDGPAGNVNWNLLSPLAYELHPTSGQYITAHDGTQLWIEVTLPQGEGPWPTVIAASPYNGQAGRIPDSGEGGAAPGTPAMWTYWTQDYAKRGYAAVNIDVRGFGKSGGCVEVWGINEQLDQKLVVDWVADQAWSDGKVGFYGQSYVATTPVAAAVQAPEALKAIIAVAPVIDAYYDWHFGGVPNGESSLSPVAYQVLTDMLGTNYLAQELNADASFPTDMATFAQYAVKGICDPTLVPLANDPRAVHGAYFDERDFGARAGDIQAAVLFTQGFEDANVKSAMIPDWFNAIEAPKLGVFGHWLHQHPSRMDAEALFLGWMDEFVKGKPLGLVDAYPNAVISADETLHRAADVWPPTGDGAPLYLDFTADALSWSPGAGTQELELLPFQPVVDVLPIAADSQVILTGSLAEDTPIVAPRLMMDGSINGENGFVYAELRELYADGGSRLLTWGMKNLALGDNVDTYTPFAPGDSFEDVLTFRETEHLAAAGSQLQLLVRGVQVAEAIGTAQPQAGTITLNGAGTYLDLGAVSLDEYHPIPLTALP